MFTWTVFLLTYLGLAFGKLPGSRIDRAGIALVGATLFLVAGGLSLRRAVAAVNFETLLLLLGMMILVAYLRQGELFERVMDAAERRLRSPHGLLAGVLVLSAALSALLVNDVVCVALSPLVIRLARRLQCHPVPHLVGLATASNIGSVATIIGNPQNMIIGRLAPVAVNVARTLPGCHPWACARVWETLIGF
jgi:Na+/H+ antiporter NhaD/arsenite permease-like protein